MRLEQFHDVVQRLRGELIDKSTLVDRGEWQGQTDRPMSRVNEIHNVVFTTPVDIAPLSWANTVMPNMPWAEDHFQERVSGEPLNPGEQYKNWPWYKQGVEEHKETGEFSHTYMERFWSKHAGEVDLNSDWGEVRTGIHFEHGDLADLVWLLQDRPLTRQAYLPIWFPEDLMASRIGQRVPCTLGYHFQIEPKQGLHHLHMTYFMRSCDFIRYFRDDVYMAGRLMHWVIKSLDNAVEGHLTVHIANLHIFGHEIPRVAGEYKEEMTRRMSDAF